MKNTNLYNKTYTVCNDTADLAHKLHSALEVFRFIVSEAHSDGLLNKEPLNCLHGVLALFESADEDMEKLEKLTAEVLQLHHALKAADSDE